MATRKRTDPQSRDVSVKKSLSKSRSLVFAQALFERKLRRSAAVCPFPTADHPPAPECFFRSRWMILIISAPLPFPIPVKSLFQFPLCHNDRSNDNDALQCTHNSPTFPTQLFPFPKTHAKTITVTGIITSPLTYQSFPQQRCAYFQVSLFFIDIAVLYPYIPLISFGGFF